MTLREFYKMICKEFNQGEPLPYKYTRKDGYWKMTKGFVNYSNKYLTASQYLKLCQMAREDKEVIELTKAKKTKGKFKVQNKYKGDLYD